MPGFQPLPVLTQPPESVSHLTLGTHPVCPVGTCAFSAPTHSLAFAYSETWVRAVSRGAERCSDGHLNKQTKKSFKVSYFLYLVGRRSVRSRTVASSERAGRAAPERVRTDADLAHLLRVVLQVLHQPVSENIQGTPGLLGESQRVQKEHLWRGAGPRARSHTEAGCCR